MLPAAHRLVSSDAFRASVRSGRRCGSRTLVVHLAVHSPGDPALVGFVVSKAVGNAVVRNRVKRRLRHLTREHLPVLAGLPGSAVLVVRALPPAAAASGAELAADLRRCLGKVTSKAAAEVTP
ncbi:ribonuclease P protein component [Nocardioides sp.]|uniref:ribonuclease P protein component n=1 Tax=Nocardioides sp. TaxID=35761 RepID=UPI002CD2E249|nr:ribonuclease P protein component [Nocardioides sp.]HXH81003.1 ribonuclease P protein component [Nocardioides sp.]